MQTQIVFNFLEQQQLLVPFLQQPTVLQDLEKQDLLLLVEKLLNPLNVIKQNNTTKEVETPTIVECAVDTVYRQNTIRLSVQDVLNRLQNDGIVSVGSSSKNTINKIAYDLGLINKICGGWCVTKQGESLGITTRSQTAVWYSLEAYDEIKSCILNK